MAGGIWLGDTEGADFKVGTAQVQKIMAGTVQVWPVDAPVTGTAFQVSASGNVFSGVCDDVNLTTRYHDGALPTPVIGDKVFTDISLTIPVVGNLQYFKLALAEYIRIDDSGEITVKDPCL